MIVNVKKIWNLKRPQIDMHCWQLWITLWRVLSNQIFNLLFFIGIIGSRWCSNCVGAGLELAFPRNVTLSLAWQWLKSNAPVVDGIRPCPFLVGPPGFNLREDKITFPTTPFQRALCSKTVAGKYSSFVWSLSHTYTYQQSIALTMIWNVEYIKRNRASNACDEIGATFEKEIKRTFFGNYFVCHCEMRLVNFLFAWICGQTQEGYCGQCQLKTLLIQLSIRNCAKKFLTPLPKRSLILFVLKVPVLIFLCIFTQLRFRLNLVQVKSDRKKISKFN